jgi:hypothetical protein
MIGVRECVICRSSGRHLQVYTAQYNVRFHARSFAIQIARSRDPINAQFGYAAAAALTFSRADACHPRDDVQRATHLYPS